MKEYQIRGKCWRLFRPRRMPKSVSKEFGRDLYGLCEYKPRMGGGEIRVLHEDEMMPTKSYPDVGHQELRVLLHEFFHAIWPGFDEEEIDRTSSDMARVLWEEGYRKQQKGE